MPAKLVPAVKGDIVSIHSGLVINVKKIGTGQRKRLKFAQACCALSAYRA
jgi:hypothetical protein